jgi:hypothetical protein
MKIFRRQGAVAAAACLVAALVSGCGGTAAGSSAVSASGVPGSSPVAAPEDDIGPFAPASTDAASCDSGFIADMPSDFAGESTAERALAAWLTGTETRTVAAPATAPRDGWSAAGTEVEEERAFASGDWRATARQSARGEWVVTQLGCVTAFDDVAAS